MPKGSYTRSLAALQDEISGPETGPPGKKIPLPAKKQLLLVLRNELLTSIPFKTSSHQGTAGSWVLTFHRHQLRTILRIEGIHLQEFESVIRKLSKFKVRAPLVIQAKLEKQVQWIQHHVMRFKPSNVTHFG